MPQDLRDLLDASVASPPTDHLDLAAVVHQGRRRVRRRRHVVVGSVVAATVVAVAAPLALPRLTGSTGAPAAGTPPVGKVVHLSAATDARPGRDYALLSTLTNPDLNSGNGTRIVALTVSGRAVVQDGPHGVHNRSRWGYLDPATDTVDWLPSLPDGDAADQLVSADDERVVLFGYQSLERRLELWTYDAGRGTWLRGDVPTAAVSLSIDTFGGLRVDGDRAWFAVETPKGHRGQRFDLWSAPVAGGQPRDEHLVVGDFDVDGDELTYLGSTNRPDSVLHVRSLSSGADRSVDIRSGSRCNALGLERDGDRVVLRQYCGTRHGVRDDRVQVVTTDGDPVVTLQDDDLESGASSDRYVTLQSFAGRHQGSYVYDLDRERLLRLSTRPTSWSGSQMVAGRYLSWGTGTRDRQGETLRLAQMR